MNKEQLRQDIEAMREKLASMEATLNKVDMAFPQVNNTYFYIYSSGLIGSDIYNNDRVDTGRIAMGNFYQTEAEAEEARDRQKAKVRVIRKIRELEGDWVADWNNGIQPKYSIAYRHDIESFIVQSSYRFQFIDTELNSNREAQQWVIDNMADDVKLMLGVE